MQGEREIVYHTMGVLLRLSQLKLKCSQPNSRHHFMCLLFWMNEDTHAKSMSERLWMRSKWKMFQRHRWNGQNDLNRHHGWRHECTLNDYECSSNPLFPVEGSLVRMHYSLLKAYWRLIEGSQNLSLGSHISRRLHCLTRDEEELVLLSRYSVRHLWRFLSKNVKCISPLMTFCKYSRDRQPVTHSLHVRLFYDSQVQWGDHSRTDFVIWEGDA